MAAVATLSPSTPSIFEPKTKYTHSDGILVQDKVASPATTPKPYGVSKVLDLNYLPPGFYAQFLSDAAKRRKPNSIRGLFHLEKKPGVISLLAGKPNPATFPISDLKVTVRSPPSLNSDGSTKPSEEKTLAISGDRLAAGLQYGSTAGYEPFVEWLEGLQHFAHGRTKADVWSISIGCGSQDLIYKAFNAICNPGDSILVETPVYSGVLPVAEALHCDITTIATDAHGINSSSLRATLENWPQSKPRPKLLYTVPYGCNPTGMTTSAERRLEVLELARKYNFLILEDDPYYYLYFGKTERPQSYFSLEASQPEVGRVIRFDSLSKIISAGIRIGFVSGPSPILNAIDIHTSHANLQTPTITQVIIHTILESYGYEGFMRHTRMVSDFYRAKRDIFEAAMHRHLDGLAKWDTPEAGMFFWFKLLLDDPEIPAKEGTEEDSEEIIRNDAYENGVLALPGTSFLAQGGKTAYVRASFSLNEPEEVDEALRRLKETVLQTRQRRNKN